MRRLPSHRAQVGQITARNTVILVIAGAIGAAAGLLTYLAYHSIPQTLLAAGAATGGSTGLLHQFIATGTAAQGSGHPEDKGHDLPQGSDRSG